MEEPRLKHEIGDDDPAPARAAVAADLDRSTEAPLTKPEIRDDALAPAPEPPAAAVAVGGGGGGGGLQQLVVELGVRDDPRLQAACFFLVWGCCVLIYGTVLNPSTNWEHILVGFVVLTIGAGLAILTLAGDGAGRAASPLARRSS